MSLRLEHLRLPLASFALELDVELPAKVTGIFGASGAGKTSLLESVAGLRQPSRGRIVVEETVLTDVATGIFLPPERRGVGYVPQDSALFVHLNVRENLCYSQRAHAGGAVAGSLYEHVIEALQIGPLVSRRIASLSGGERQRVAFGRALLASPRLLLLDEPLASLDTELRDQVIVYLRRIRDEFKVPMLFVSHSADEIVALCEDVVVLEQGQCRDRGRVADLFTVSEKTHHVLAKKH